MTAIGNNLTQIPGGEDVLGKLSSVGISLKNTHNYQMDLNLWARRNRPPATMMVIDGHEQLRCLAPALYDLEDGGYTILIAYPQPHLATPFPRTFTNQWFWDALLSYKLEPTTTTTILVNKCNDYPWSCSVCFVAAPSFEDFTTHLKSVQHEFREWDRHASKYNLDRTNRNNLPFGRSQELDLLLSQDMLRCQEILSQKGRRGGGGFRPQFRSNSQSNSRTHLLFPHAYLSVKEKVIPNEQDILFGWFNILKLCLSPKFYVRHHSSSLCSILGWRRIIELDHLATLTREKCSALVRSCYVPSRTTCSSDDIITKQNTKVEDGLGFRGGGGGRRWQNNQPSKRHGGGRSCTAVSSEPCNHLKSNLKVKTEVDKGLEQRKVSWPDAHGKDIAHVQEFELR
ncbi:unnamed protein product [Brassica rapa subsp. narinosa]|uniref:NYN domain-containing protein n=1 Tax=Brassica campestris TaxID=3711 RepID=M4DFS4_BRACM